MIKSYAEMIRDLSGNNPEKRDKHLAVIIEETDRLNTLVNDMLSLSRMQRRTTALERTGFDIGALITEILKPYEILADQEDYIFYWEIPTEPLIIDGNKQKIQQVISNLLNNAVKYCGEDKQIIIEPHKLRGKLRIEISDHGNGIAPEELSHVWERYYKSRSFSRSRLDEVVRTVNGNKELIARFQSDWDLYQSRVQKDKEGNSLDRKSVV